MKEQKLIYDYRDISKIVDMTTIHPLVVCSLRWMDSDVFQYFKKSIFHLSIFSNFKPNPTFESVVESLQQFKKEKCNFIISIGGGSAIDVAKSLKAFLYADLDKNFLEQRIIPNDIPHLAIPTTAGTGSESTHFAVIYYGGKKYSVEEDSLLPDYVLLYPKLLESLPLYQKQSTMLDALCQGIESYWSVNSTLESKKYAKEAMKLILEHYQDYLNGREDANIYMMKAANASGKAINISKTTSAHAMSYRLTSLYGISHGHAVALCIPHIMRYMEDHIENCTDSRGPSYLRKTFEEIEDIFHTSSLHNMADQMENMLKQFGFLKTIYCTNQQLEELVSSVNIDRLQNNPIAFNQDVIRTLYSKIVTVKDKD